ncbi:MAG: DNA-binding response regulator [Candidatus Yanofskybacteria bacterium RIFCSPHIGHO2_02_FULL_38_22b]|uniref:DNA-binding response regulator n=1 Tax=Candidatus Yanofskybacteria bacterium RIFCSPHIGHO2_02_FULL_38_22b TaxID=1802673 RepID=A0A1F8F133_9BACT|nr:MAG: DNA-binding response regulator [Candidatus Yanofskybacteria bacterium RIFCSPHIGHO2_01_FULL_39_44]OGN06851.1 MAG: DNA-binding response regulator [Candidatus Yanofskybacteria bacterium RIFCSPHIGHO2_02_FULL_38_22b]OGN20746.1 MAG: DNA-binding response regulator [Candidatus Yanofskybacteria bacterium RIFCSPLOWO2_01_FULL_39_28]
MRILVVEDEKEIRYFLKASLGAELFSVDAVEDGERGLYLASVNDYDVIVLDNILPKKSGLEICSELRKKGKNTPIIIVSVKTDTTTKIELLNAGADDYLIKPFSFEELMARIRALIRRPQQVKGEVLTSNDLILETKKHTVKRGKKEIHLTRKEFMLLEYLLSNKGSVLSRGMILEHVWDMDTDPFSNTIETHILSLRRKIDTPHSKKLISTVSGCGYKIAD